MNYFCVYQNFLIYGIYGYMVYIQSHTAYIRYMEIPYTVWANPNYFLCAFARGQEHRTCIHNNTHTHKHWHTHPHTHAHPHKNTHIHPHTRTHIFTQTQTHTFIHTQGHIYSHTHTLTEPWSGSPYPAVPCAAALQPTRVINGHSYNE
jgi:hypothetical protein